jgi:hypothetical protein
MRASYGRRLYSASWRHSLFATCPHRRHVRSVFRNESPWCVFYRGAKTVSTVRLRDLPQGPLMPEQPLAPLVNDVSQYPTVIQGARNNMVKFQNCVLLTRVGSFYEVRRLFPEDICKCALDINRL